MVNHPIRGGASRRISSSLSSTDWIGTTTLLPRDRIDEVMRSEAVKQYKCLYSVPVTVWTFLMQVIGPDRCCRAAVARLLAALSVLDRAARALLGVCGGLVGDCETGDGQQPPDTGPYCKARERLPVSLLKRLAKQAGADLHRKYPASRFLGGRPVKIVDGTIVSMPDTPENQKQFPQPHTQKKGLGFPIMRVVAVLSLFGGAVLDMTTGPYKGKGTGESSLFRTLLDGLEAGDIMLADRYYASYWLISMLLQRGVDCVMRQHQHRRVDFRRGQQLGRDDHIIWIPKPKQMPDWMDDAAYAKLPSELKVREVRVRVAIKGFRVKCLVAATTLLDPVAYPASEIAKALRYRWDIELDLRSIKQTLGMTVLRCKTPEMVVKEAWVYMLAYNLIRATMAEAAMLAGVEPRALSFAGAVQTLVAFSPMLHMAKAKDLPRLWRRLLRMIAHHRVRGRPNRFEPRAVKRRSKPIAFLTVPRDRARKRLARNAAAKC